MELAETAGQSNENTRITNEEERMGRGEGVGASGGQVDIRITELQAQNVFGLCERRGWGRGGGRGRGEGNYRRKGREGGERGNEGGKEERGEKRCKISRVHLLNLEMVRM